MKLSRVNGALSNGYCAKPMVANATSPLSNIRQTQNCDSFSSKTNMANNKVAFKSTPLNQISEGVVHELRALYAEMRKLRLDEQTARATVNESYTTKLSTVDRRIKKVCEDQDFVLGLREMSEKDARFIVEYQIEDASEGIPVEETNKKLKNLFHQAQIVSIISHPHEFLKQFEQNPQLITDNKLLLLIRLCQRKIGLETAHKLDNKVLEKELFYGNHDAYTKMDSQESELLGLELFESVPVDVVVQKLCALDKDIQTIWDSNYSKFLKDLQARSWSSASPQINDILSNKTSYATYNWLKGYSSEEDIPF